eukprot:gnl/MRDRNA2_/MRDRNA2_164207_c0_seq1.p1 gnl/MRDRNA2_/MRDRNA2_164207_c0~~gnl/MRDRNA2_/MRDRNA2_164207_c0_seq1.p1  ORF type:complete len:806 (-),score=175.04 gnl/MRDRNA2_/MRDRNA2_164207_c0_seq1:619-3036(-)
MPVITQEEVFKCRRAFKKLDHNNDGSMQVHELRFALRDCCTPEQIDNLIEGADTDKNGRIDFAEFLRLAQTELQSQQSEDRSPGTTAPALKDLLPEEFTQTEGSDPASPSKGKSYSSSVTPEKDELEKSYSELIVEVSSERKKVRKYCCYIIPLIHPNSQFAGVWQVVTAFAILYAALMTPVLLAFEDQFYGEAKDQVVMVDTVINCVFMLDILLTFVSMYNDGKGDLISDPKIIAKSYITTWFCPDVISCIPLDFIMGSDSGGGLLYAKLARMGKMARVLRLLKMLKMLKLVRLVKFYTNFDRIFQKAFNDKYEGESSKSYQFLKFCIVALLVAHVAGCLWYALAKFHEDISETWIVNRDIQDAEILDQYLHSMYFIITTLTTVGYGDISASTNAEIVVAILLMMGGVLGYSIAVGTVSSVLMQVDQRQTLIANKMQTLAYFAKETDMDLKEYQKIQRHIKQKYYSSLDWMDNLSGAADLQSLLHDLPVVLRAKMLRHMHHGRHLKLEFFSRYRDDDLFAYLVPLLASDHFQVHDMIYLRGDYAERVYFLTKGTVVFFIFERFKKFARSGPIGSGSGSGKAFNQLSSKDYNDIEQDMMKCEPFQIIVDGSTFGDFEVLLGIPRQQCVRCDVESDCLRLHKKDLLCTLAEFPAIAECMRRDARHEFHMTQKRKKRHIENKGLSIYDVEEDFDQYNMEDELDNQKSLEFSGTFSPQKPPGSPAKEVAPDPPQNCEPPQLPVLRSDQRFEDAPLEPRNPQLEDRLRKIEQHQQELLIRQEKQDVILKDVQSTLFSIDLRIQSLVLRS